MAVSPTNSLLIESVNTGEQSHDAEWIAFDLQRVVESLGCHVVGAITDNTSANKKAWRILKQANPSSHGLHLMVKDIYSPTKKSNGSLEATNPELYPFEDLLLFAGSCKDAVSLFRNHLAMKAKLKKAFNDANIGGPISPAVTRWGSLFSCFRSLLNADTVLNTFVCHREFESTGTTKQRRRIKDIITDSKFLDQLKISIAILEPIDMFITKFQSDSVPVPRFPTAARIDP